MLNELAIPVGYVGTEITVRRMWKFVNEDYKAESLRRISIEVVRGIAPKNYFGEADAIFKFVKNTIKYQRDPEGAERIADSFVTLQEGAGDCDDHAILVASMAKSIGFPVRFATLNSQWPDKPLYFNHVYAEIGFDDWETGADGKTYPAIKWVAADTTEPASYFGWDPEPYYFKKVWENPLNNYTEGDIMGYRMSGRVTLPYQTIDGLGGYDWIGEGTKLVEKAITKYAARQTKPAPTGGGTTGTGGAPSAKPKKTFGMSMPLFIGVAVGTVAVIGGVIYFIKRKK